MLPTTSHMSALPPLDEQAPAARMTPRYARKREAILHAAAQLFNQSGIKGATLSDVAGKVGLSTNSITYYYKKKEDLVVACMLRSIEVINAIIDRAAAAPEPGERVRRFIGYFFERLAQIERAQAPEMMSFRDVQALGSPHVDIIFAAYTDLFRRVRHLLAGDVPLPADRLPINARTHLLLTLTVASMRWCRRYDPDDYGLAAERMAEVLLEGLGNAGARWEAGPLDAALMQTEAAQETPQDAFLRAATQLINELGYHGASVDRISARLNVTKGSFYHHNPNKEDLVSACFERSFATIRRVQAVAMEGPGSGWEKLGASARALVRYQFSEQGPLLRMSAWSELPDELREDKQRTINRLDQRFVAMLVDGMQDGSIRPLDQTIAALQISGMINAAVMLDRWVPDATVEHALQLFVRPLFVGILRD